MKRTVISGFIVVLALASLVAADDKKANVLLQAALAKETIQGDLKGAIELYQRAVKEAGGNRALAAQALLHEAECYQKLGSTQARKIYEQLVREYADQKDAVAVARAHLRGTEIASGTPATALRKVWAGPKVDALGTVAPNGRDLSFTDWETGDLALHDLTTGIDRRLTNKGPWAQSNEFAEESAISRDGSQVAYAWFNGKDRYEIRLVDLKTSGLPTPRRLFDNEDVDWIAPYDWSPDGKHIAVQLQRRDRTAQVGVVAVEDGSLRVLKSVDWRGATKVLFSPDGKHLAFDLPVGDNSEQRDIAVLFSDGGREIRAVSNPGHGVLMGWSPDGARLLFTSDRGGTTGLWSQRLTDGRPEGSAELIKLDVGQHPLGFSAAGNLYLAVLVGNRDVHTASLDFDTGKLLTPPIRPVERFIGFNEQPDWSRDGKYLAYISARNRVGRNRVLAVRSVETGHTRELQLKLANFNWPRWSPDGGSFIAQGTDLKGRQGVYRIDAQTGDVAPIAFRPPGGGGLGTPQWSPDGKQIYYRSETPGDVAFLERDLASGSERDVIRRPTVAGAGNQLGTMNLSPDGRYIVTNSTDAKTSGVLLIPVGGGEPRELLRVSQPQQLQARMSWTVDSRQVIASTSATGDLEHNEVLLVPVDAGAPRKADIGAPSSGPIRVHPDGRQIAFVSGERKTEVWVLENFLPALKASR